MLEPIDTIIGTYRIYPVDGRESDIFDSLADDIYAILSDESTLKFIPEKRLNSTKEAQKWLYTAVLNFHASRNYLHLIFCMTTGRVVGMIDILSPSLIREHYRLAEYTHFMEFYLKSEVQGARVMTGVLPVLLGMLQAKGIRQIAAVADRKNIAARRVLIKSGFSNSGMFDQEKDLFHYSFLSSRVI
jgi:ribosomal-protein-alanine N-acetyltransferase